MHIIYIYVINLTRYKNFSTLLITNYKINYFNYIIRTYKGIKSDVSHFLNLLSILHDLKSK